MPDLWRPGIESCSGLLRLSGGLRGLSDAARTCDLGDIADKLHEAAADVGVVMSESVVHTALPGLN